MNETVETNENVENTQPDTETPNVRTEDNGDECSTENYDSVLAQAKQMRFHNPGFAAKVAMGEKSPMDELNRLANEEGYMVGRKVNPSNPSITREAPGSANRIRRALQAKRLRLYK